MKIIYDDAKDKYVASVVMYGDSEDNKLYYSTEDDKEQVSQADLEDAFMKKQLLIVVDDATFVPVCVSGNVVKVISSSESAVSLVSFEAIATA